MTGACISRLAWCWEGTCTSTLPQKAIAAHRVLNSCTTSDCINGHEVPIALVEDNASNYMLDSSCEHLLRSVRNRHPARSCTATEGRGPTRSASPSVTHDRMRLVTSLDHACRPLSRPVICLPVPASISKQPILLHTCLPNTL